MAVLVLGEVTGGVLARDATAKAVSAVKGLGEVSVLVVGESTAAAAAEAAGIAGVAKVLTAEGPAYGHRLAEPMAALVLALAPGFSHIAAPATTEAKNILPRVAALLDVMVITDVTAVVDAGTFQRPVYAGKYGSAPS